MILSTTGNLITEVTGWGTMTGITQILFIVGGIFLLILGHLLDRKYSYPILEETQKKLNRE